MWQPTILFNGNRRKAHAGENIRYYIRFVGCRPIHLEIQRLPSLQTLSHAAIGLWRRVRRIFPCKYISLIEQSEMHPTHFLPILKNGELEDRSKIRKKLTVAADSEDLPHGGLIAGNYRLSKICFQMLDQPESIEIGTTDKNSIAFFRIHLFD